VWGLQVVSRKKGRLSKDLRSFCLNVFSPSCSPSYVQNGINGWKYISIFYKKPRPGGKFPLKMTTLSLFLMAEDILFTHQLNLDLSPWRAPESLSNKGRRPKERDYKRICFDETVLEEYKMPRAQCYVQVLLEM
jgi:hypothetical protein